MNGHKDGQTAIPWTGFQVIITQKKVMIYQSIGRKVKITRYNGQMEKCLTSCRPSAPNIKFLVYLAVYFLYLSNCLSAIS